MCGFGSPDFALVGHVPQASFGDEAVGYVLNADSSLCDTQNELKGFVIAEIGRLTVHVQEDCGLPAIPGDVAINQRTARHDRMQESSRFELGSRVDVLSEKALD